MTGVFDASQNRLSSGRGSRVEMCSGFRGDARRMHSGVEMSSERQIEMTWRCTSCGHQNLGRHMACQGCGGPKDESEQYEMPSDTASAATVTDPELLRMARAGANWRCRYCGSDQRTLAGTCAQCGAAQGEGRSTAVVRPTVEAPVPGLTRASPLRLGAMVFVCGAVAFLVAVLGLLGVRSPGRVSQRAARGTPSLSLPFHFEEASVTGVRWKQTLVVERWQVVPGEGFEEAKPADAFDVHPAGQRFHHKERVVVGQDTQTYTETEPDGFQTESYTEHEACGQDCTPRPQSCSEKCTPNQNGFASCKTVCTGGGQDCRTKYCDVPKTRQVPKTKTVTKTRQVPRYGDVDRDAPWHTWKVWVWKVARTAEKTGTTPATEWPDEKALAVGKGLGPGQKERVSRKGEYVVELQGPSGARKLELATGDALASYAAGSKRRVRVWRSGRVEVL